MHPADAALRVLTAGSVDDGKSTLIGRLLVDSQAVLADQLAAISSRTDGGAIDLSLLTDGLEAEREQGITIDVAFRYFATPRRKFILADAPGHEQYTRNMVTAAAGSDVALVLVDVTKVDWRARPVRLLPQTRRHALLAQLLRVPHIVFVVNKLDACDAPGPAFEATAAALRTFASEAGIELRGVVPVSALRGDNVVRRFPAPWYDGPSLLEVLEPLSAAHESADAPFALAVQYVMRHDDGRRILWGSIAQGAVEVGDAVEVLAAREQARVAGLYEAGRASPRRSVGDSAGLVLDRPIDVSRGDWIAAPGSLESTATCRATLAWLDVEPAVLGRRYWLRHGHRWILGRITAIDSVLDIHTLQPGPAHRLAANEIGEVHVEWQEPVPMWPYRENRSGGAAIVVDCASHRTSGALLVRSVR